MTKSKRRLVWSADAENDLLAIWRYGAEEWSPDKADEYEREIWSACTNLLAFPLFGRQRDGLMVGMRSLRVRSHVVFYKAMTTTIQILRVLHMQEDAESIFP